MPITLKYGAPGPVLLAGYAGGVGQRQKRQQEDSLKLWQQQQQQNFQAQQAGYNRLLQVGLQQNQFAQQNAVQQKQNEFAVQQQKQRFEFDTSRDAVYRDFQRDQQGALLKARADEGVLARQQQFDLARQHEGFLSDQATLEGVRKGQLELPPEAQSKLQKLESGRVEAMKLDPPQQREFMDQYEREKSALLGLAQPKKELSLGEDFDKNVMERDGTLYQRDARGGFSVLREAPDDPMIELNKQFQADTEKYWSQVQKEAQRLQGADESATPKGLEGYVEQAQKNLSLFKVNEPQRAQPVMTDPKEMPEGVQGKMVQMTDGSYQPWDRVQGMQPQQVASQPPPPSTNPAVFNRPENAPPGPPPPQGVTLESLSKEDRAMAEKFLPRPVSGEDRNRLQPGTRYIAPDGSIRTWEGSNAG